MTKSKLEMIDERAILTATAKKLIEAGKLEKRKLTEDENKEFDNLTVQISTLNKEIQLAETRAIEQTKVNNIQIKNEVKMEKVSLLKMIEARANGRNLSENELALVNLGKDELRKSGLSATGDIQIPTEYRANIQATVATAGQEIVAEDKMGLIAPIREKLILVEAGATFLSGLVGDVSIPAYGGTSALWKGEVAAATDGAGTFSEVTLSPKRLTTYIDVSKQFLMQDSADAEKMLMQDIVNSIAIKLESTVLGKEAGSTTQPAGMFATAPTIAGVATWANVLAMETAVDTANALGNGKYITNAGGRGVLKGTLKAAGTGIYLLQDNEMNGYPVLTTNNVAKALQAGANEFGVVFGDWSQMLIGQWGAIDLVVDAVSQAINGNVRIVVNAYFDAKPRVAGAFKTASVKYS